MVSTVKRERERSLEAREWRRRSLLRRGTVAWTKAAFARRSLRHATVKAERLRQAGEAMDRIAAGVLIMRQRAARRTFVDSLVTQAAACSAKETTGKDDFRHSPVTETARITPSMFRDSLSSSSSSASPPTLSAPRETHSPASSAASAMSPPQPWEREHARPWSQREDPGQGEQHEREQTVEDVQASRVQRRQGHQDLQKRFHHPAFVYSGGAIPRHDVNRVQRPPTSSPVSFSSTSSSSSFPPPWRRERPQPRRPVELLYEDAFANAY